MSCHWGVIVDPEVRAVEYHCFKMELHHYLESKSIHWDGGDQEEFRDMCRTETKEALKGLSGVLVLVLPPEKNVVKKKKSVSFWVCEKKKHSHFEFVKKNQFHFEFVKKKNTLILSLWKKNQFHSEFVGKKISFVLSLCYI